MTDRVCSNRVTCPDCKGAKGWQRVVHTQVCGQLEEWEDHHARYCVDESGECPTCRGDGTISDVQMAVYRARGGPAPTQVRGYA